MSAQSIAHLLTAVAGTAIAVTALARSGRSSLLWAVVMAALTVAAWNGAHGLLLLTRDDSIRILAPALGSLPLAAFCSLALRAAVPRARWRPWAELVGWLAVVSYSVITLSGLLFESSRAFVLSSGWNVGFASLAAPFLVATATSLVVGSVSGRPDRRPLCRILLVAAVLGFASGLSQVLPPGRPLELGSPGMLLAVVLGAVAVARRQVALETIALQEILAVTGGVAAVVIAAVLVVARAQGSPLWSSLGLAILGIVALGAYHVIHRRWQGRLHEATRLASLGRATSVLAHEVRNPLTTVQGAIDILDQELGSCGRHADSQPYLDMARSEIARVLTLVQDALSYARAPTPARERFDLRVLLQRAVDAARLQHPGQDISLADGHPVEVEADSGQLTQVFDNLVLNACQSREGARVKLSIARTEAALVEVHVVDDGPGVAEELRDRVFEPFFTTKLRGGGLGLAIVREIARRHGGDVTLGRCDEGGARFTVVLARNASEEELS
ncbi:MAG: HAMP domain-containing sensor histidine kinase [Pseudomonadota bacterium]